MTVADELATVLDLLDGLATATEASQAVTMRDDGPCCHFVVHSRSWHAELKRADTPKCTADTMSRSCVTSANPSPNRAPAQEGGSTGWDRRGGQFDSLTEVGTVIEKMLLKHGVTVHPSGYAKRLYEDA